MKMKRIPYKRLIAGVTRQVKVFIRSCDSVAFDVCIYADPFTGDVRLDDCPEDGHYHGTVALFLTDVILDEKRTPDARKIEHWVRADLRHYAERVFQGQCFIQKRFGTSS